MGKTAGKTKSDPTPQSMRDKLIQAAYRCFARNDVQKTSMEDVASEAGCSRQTLYNHFASKRDLVTEICLIEGTKLNRAMQKAADQHKGLEDKLTASFLLALDASRRNPYHRRLIELADVRERITHADDAIHALQRDYWAPLLKTSHKGVRVADDLDVDEIVTWILFNQMALLSTFEPDSFDSSQVERMIRRLIVAPLLARK